MALSKCPLFISNRLYPTMTQNGKSKYTQLFTLDSVNLNDGDKSNYMIQKSFQQFNIEEGKNYKMKLDSKYTCTILPDPSRQDFRQTNRRRREIQMRIRILELTSYKLK